MIPRYLFYLLGAFLLLTIAIRLFVPDTPVPGRYELVRVNEHTAVLVDTATGRTWQSYFPGNVIGPTGWRQLEWDSKER